MSFIRSTFVATFLISSSLWAAPRLKLHYQLSGTPKNYSKANWVGVDLFDGSKSLVDKLHKEGKFVVCYFSAGTAENYRSDYKSFPKSAVGKTMSDWPDEKWLDIKNPGVLTVHKKRLDRARDMGCDGVDPDNVDGYANKTGFTISQNDQIKFLRSLVKEARARGLDIGLKNATDIAKTVAKDFDWIIVEECYKWKECGQYQAFPDLGKPAFLIEYTKYSQKNCDDANKRGMSLMFADMDLKGPFTYCK